MSIESVVILHPSLSIFQSDGMLHSVLSITIEFQSSESRYFNPERKYHLAQYYSEYSSTYTMYTYSFD